MPGIRDDIEEALKEAAPQGGNVNDSPVVDVEAREIPEATGDRDTSGRFAPRTPAKNEVPPDQEQKPQEPLTGEQPQAAAPAPAAQSLRAPASWTPEERQGWETLTPAHQQAVLRRETEISRTLAQTAEQRKFAGEVQQVLQPYMGMIESEGGTPIKAIQSVMQTAAALRTAPPMHKASLVADLVMQFGIDPGHLDNALSARMSGRPAPNDPYAPIMQALEQKLQPFQQFMGSFQQQQQQVQQRVVQEAEQTLEQFLGDPANEFAADVAGDMADILEYAAQRGQQMTLQDAYKRATLLHPSISKIVEGRMSAQGAAQQTAAAQKARSAAVSVSGGAPSVSSGTDDEVDDVRSALGAAIKHHSNRR